MPTYRKKGVVDAVQWFKDGDHAGVCPFLTDGMIVNRHLSGRDMAVFNKVSSSEILESYGWVGGRIGCALGKRIVCPGDWIVIQPSGEIDIRSPEDFAATYERTV